MPTDQPRPATAIFDFDDAIAGSPMLPDLLAALQACDVRTAAVSSARPLVDITRPFGSALNVVFERERVGDDRNLFLAAAEWFGVPPDTCCGIGNSPEAIQAIVAAGMCPIAIGKPVSAEELGKAGAFRVFQGFRFLTAFRIEQTFQDWHVERERAAARAAAATGPKKNGAPA
ncbi:hypothetical protein HY635_03545 [Candidatus Uhrbacteria bacterium]|nr:hypothetical protein [Candidatus Uhrbacteria bacterium]